MSFEFQESWLVTFIVLVLCDPVVGEESVDYQVFEFKDDLPCLVCYEKHGGIFGRVVVAVIKEHDDFKDYQLFRHQFKPT